MAKKNNIKVRGYVSMVMDKIFLLQITLFSGFFEDSY
jgi:hypothetical protein